MQRKDTAHGGETKGKGGVMILLKEEIVVEEVEWQKLLSVVIKIKGSEKRKIIVTYITPKTNAWETPINLKACN